MNDVHWNGDEMHFDGHLRVRRVGSAIRRRASAHEPWSRWILSEIVPPTDQGCSVLIEWRPVVIVLEGDQ